MRRMLLPPPLSLYVHVPWCVRKCPYCDFNSHEQRGAIPQHEYVDALLADLEQDLPDVWGRRIESVFIGGGTPSLLSGEAVQRLRGYLEDQGRDPSAFPIEARIVQPRAEPGPWLDQVGYVARGWVEIFHSPRPDGNGRT